MAGHQEKPLRIVLLGKSGDGKSSAGNTILGEDAFLTSNTPTSETFQCKSKSDEGDRITVTDTPGLFDTRCSEEDVKKEIVRCIIECSPGPHAFLIVLKVGRYTEQEEKIVEKLADMFGDEAYKHTIVIFTRGDELNANQNIEDFVRQNDKLKSFVDKCGNRCHVIDNKYWRNTQDEYRSNRVQVGRIISTVQKMATNSVRGWYTNEILRDVETRIQEAEQEIRQEPNILSTVEIKSQARQRVFNNYLLKLATVGIEMVLSMFLGRKKT